MRTHRKDVPDVFVMHCGIEDTKFQGEVKEKKEEDASLKESKEIEEENSVLKDSYKEENIELKRRLDSYQKEITELREIVIDSKNENTELREELASCKKKIGEETHSGRCVETWASKRWNSQEVEPSAPSTT